MDKISKDIDNLKKTIYKLWIDTKESYPNFFKKESYLKKIKTGRKLNSYLKIIISLINELIKENLNMDECQNEILALVKVWFIESNPKKIENTKDLEEFIDKMCKATEEFISRTRSFCSKINNDEIFQALRNLWAMLVYQFITLGDIKLTKSIFAYSMLYPCTDNYIDDKDITYEEKEIFNDNILKRLFGYKVESENYEFQRVCRLIHMIEQEYPRLEYSFIYDAMIYMQKAQQLSLKQQVNTKALNEKELLDISIEKGGLSVLIHGYLVKGKIDNSDVEFLYAFGVLLQICDDIQDIKEDLNNGHYTLATKVGERWKLDILTNNLFSFCKTVFGELNKSKNLNCSWIYEIMELKIYNMIIFAVYSSRYMYSKEYVKNIMKNFPYTIFYLKTFNLRCNIKVKKIEKNLKGKDILEFLSK